MKSKVVKEVEQTRAGSSSSGLASNCRWDNLDITAHLEHLETSCHNSTSWLEEATNERRRPRRGQERGLPQQRSCRGMGGQCSAWETIDGDLQGRKSLERGWVALEDFVSQHLYGAF